MLCGLACPATHPAPRRGPAPGRYRGRRHFRARADRARRGSGAGRSPDYRLGRGCVGRRAGGVQRPSHAHAPAAFTPPPLRAVWEFMNDQDAVDLAMQYEGHPRDAAVALCQESLRRWREVRSPDAAAATPRRTAAPYPRPLLCRRRRSWTTSRQWSSSSAQARRRRRRRLRAAPRRRQPRRPPPQVPPSPILWSCVRLGR